MEAFVDKNDYYVKCCVCVDSVFNDPEDFAK